MGSTSKPCADHDRSAGGLCKCSAAMIPFDTAEKKVTAGAGFDILLNYLHQLSVKAKGTGLTAIVVWEVKNGPKNDADSADFTALSK